MSEDHPLFGLGQQAHERSAQLQSMLPSLEHDLTNHYKPFTFNNVVSDPSWVVITLQFVVHHISALIPKLSEARRATLPSFIVDLYHGDWRTQTDKIASALPRYPWLRRYHLWECIDELNSIANFFMRSVPHPSVYDFCQHLLHALGSNVPFTFSLQLLTTQVTSGNASLYSAPFPDDQSAQRLHNYVSGLQAKISTTRTEIQVDMAVDAVAETAPVQAFEIVQVKGSGKTSMLKDLSKRHMLGLRVDLGHHSGNFPYVWSNFLLDDYSIDDPSWSTRKKTNFASFLACFLSAVSIQLSRLVRARAIELGWDDSATKPLTLQQWSQDVVPHVSEIIQSQPWTKLLWTQTGYLSTHEAPLTSGEMDDVVSQQTLSSSYIAPDVYSNDLSSKRAKAPEESVSDLVGRFSKKALPYFSEDASNADSLARTLVEILGQENVQGQPLFFLALDDCFQLGTDARDVLILMWKALHHQSFWLMLASCGLRRYSSLSEQCKIEAQWQRLAPFHKLLTFGRFVETAKDLGWNATPPSADGFSSTVLTGVCFAGLECVSFRYGRPLWLAHVYDPHSTSMSYWRGVSAQEPDAHFGGVSIRKVIKDVLDIHPASEFDELYLSLRMPLHWFSSLSSSRNRLSTLRIASSPDIQGAKDNTASILSLRGRHEGFQPLKDPVCSAAAAYLCRTNLKRWRGCLFKLFLRGGTSEALSWLYGSLLVLHMASDAAHFARCFGDSNPEARYYEVFPPPPAPDQAVGSYGRYYADGSRQGETSKASKKDKGKASRIEGILEGITVYAWLEMLISKEALDAAEQGAKVWMRNKLVNFTSVASSDLTWDFYTPLPLGMLIDGWVRQCAWLLEPGEHQTAWHVLVPVHTANEEYIDTETGQAKQGSLGVHPFDPTRLSHVLIVIAPPKVELVALERDEEQEVASRSLPEAAECSVQMWSQIRDNTKEGCQRIYHMSHLVISINLAADGSADWQHRSETLQSGLKSGDENAGYTHLQRHDLQLKGGKGGLLDTDASPWMKLVRPDIDEELHGWLGIPKAEVADTAE